MEKAIFRASLMLAASIVFGTVWAGLMFRYDVAAWGGTVMVHDRFRGTVVRCVGDPTVSRCFPLLATGMRPISPPAAKTNRKFTDQEFKDMMDRATRAAEGKAGE